jgi:hypothetical protein
MAFRLFPMRCSASPSYETESFNGTVGIRVCLLPQDALIVGWQPGWQAQFRIIELSVFEEMAYLPGLFIVVQRCAIIPFAKLMLPPRAQLIGIALRN